MRFLVDAQLPPALARIIGELGHDGIHVADVGLIAASDSTIWEQAISLDAIIITKDQDFAQRRARVDGPVIVWLRLGNMRRANLLSQFRAAFPQLLEAVVRGEPVVEIR